MQWEKWDPSPRDILLDRVRRGEITPDEAEREAENQGFGPLATKPNAVEFEPDEMAWWSLPMAVAWIAWRSLNSVREHCAEYRENWLHWMPGSWNVPTNNGTEFERIDGYELRASRQSTVCRLSMVEAYLASTKTLPPTTKMTVAEAEKRLFTALADGRVKAIARDAAGNVVDIPQREWPYLQLFEEGLADVLKHDALDPKPAFSEIKLERNVLKEIWPNFPIEPYMIEPMTRMGSAGYVPLCAALQWIATNGGREPGHLEDKKSWESCVARLLPLISTGEVEIVGKPVIGGPVERLDQRIFAQIHLTQPLRDSIYGLGNDEPWVSCMPFVDDHYWTNGFNDQLYMRKGTNPAWTHLQVRKGDLLREFPFPETPPSKLSAPKKLRADMPAMQAAIIETAAQLWPDGQIPPRVKERNSAICKHLKTNISDKTIQRAFSRRS
jgi:hypothetical protein